MSFDAKVMSLEQCARYLNLSVWTVYRKAKLGQLPCYKVGSLWRFNIEDIDNWRLSQGKQP